MEDDFEQLNKIFDLFLKRASDVEKDFHNVLSVVGQLEKMKKKESKEFLVLTTLPERYTVLIKELISTIKEELRLKKCKQILSRKLTCKVICLPKDDSIDKLQNETIVETTQAQQVICHYCRKKGHTIECCRQLKRKNRKEMDQEDTNMAGIYPESSLQPKKLRKPGVTILNEILKTIKLDDYLIKENNQLLLVFLKTFIDQMKNEDPLFSSLYQKPHFTGSYYSDLRISQPDEFDINVLLNLPFKEKDFEVQYHPQVPSYAKYHLKYPEVAARDHPQLVKILFKDGYLIPDNMRKWIQSVVDKALRKYTCPQGIQRIVSSSSGPARTLKLVKQRNGIIDIDLVPVISCVLETKQPGIDGRVRNKLGISLQTFLVPKPYSPTNQAPVNAVEITRLWRTHFPEAEEELIHDKSCAKPVIKLLKLLRDKSIWKILASYYLKTVVMWMLLEHPEKDYWKGDKMDERFIEALQNLADNVRDRKIPYFFSKKHNLISKINNDQSTNIYNKLCAIIKSVQKDPSNFWAVFGISPTFTLP